MASATCGRNSAMRVAMTGGGGFLGSHLLARLIGAGSLVTLVGPELGPSRYTASMVAAGRARFVRCDADFTDGVAAQSIADASALVLMDSLSQPSASPPERLVDEIEASLAPLVRLLCAFASRGGHVVFASSGAVYGDPVHIPSRESDLPRPRSTFALASLILDTSRARSDLAFAPRHALADGLKEEVGWLKATFEGNLKSAA